MARPKGMSAVDMRREYEAPHPSETLREETARIYAEAHALGMRVIQDGLQGYHVIIVAEHPQTKERREWSITMPPGSDLRTPGRVQRTIQEGRYLG